MTLPAPEPSSASSRATSAFEVRFRACPNNSAIAPGRINLIGEHIDYSGGHVLPIAINRHCAIALGPSSTQISTLLALDAPPNQPSTFSFPHTADLRTLSLPRGHWPSYILGVIHELTSSWLSEPGALDLSTPQFTTPLLPSLPPLNIVIASDVPIGAGLSSSAALEVACARALFDFTNTPWNPLPAALACQRAEHHFAGVPCGLMDQLASSACTPGHALLIDFASPSAPTLRQIPFPSPDRAELLIIDSGIRHALASSEYPLRCAASQSAAAKLGVSLLCHASPDLLLRHAHLLTETELCCARHAITENHRTIAAAEALASSDLSALGTFMNASHASLRDDYRVSCDELDTIVTAAQSHPATFGARLTGGGFGGSAIALIDPKHSAAIQQAITSAFFTRFHRAPTITPL